MSRSISTSEAEALEKINLINSFMFLLASVVFGVLATESLFSDINPYASLFITSKVVLVSPLLLLGFWATWKTKKLQHKNLITFLHGRNWSSFDDSFTNYAGDKAFIISWWFGFTAMVLVLFLDSKLPFLPTEFFILFILSVMFFSNGISYLLLIRNAKDEEAKESV